MHKNLLSKKRGFLINKWRSFLSISQTWQSSILQNNQPQYESSSLWCSSCAEASSKRPWKWPSHRWFQHRHSRPRLSILMGIPWMALCRERAFRRGFPSVRERKRKKRGGKKRKRKTVLVLAVLHTSPRLSLFHQSRVALKSLEGKKERRERERRGRR